MRLKGIAIRRDRKLCSNNRWDARAPRALGSGMQSFHSGCSGNTCFFWASFKLSCQAQTALNLGRSFFNRYFRKIKKTILQSIQAQFLDPIPMNVGAWYQTLTQSHDRPQSKSNWARSDLKKLDQSSFRNLMWLLPLHSKVLQRESTFCVY